MSGNCVVPVTVETVVVARLSVAKERMRTKKYTYFFQKSLPTASLKPALSRGNFTNNTLSGINAIVCSYICLTNWSINRQSLFIAILVK